MAQRLADALYSFGMAEPHPKLDDIVAEIRTRLIATTNRADRLGRQIIAMLDAEASYEAETRQMFREILGPAYEDA
jgi:hypothetical protein